MFGKHQNFVGKVFLSSILKIFFKNYFIIFLKQKFLFWQLESLKHGIAGLYVLHEQGNLLELVDPILGSNNSEFGFLCTSPSPTLRPNSASSVVSTLQGKIAVQAPVVKRSSMNKAFERLSQDSPSHASAFSQESQVQGSISNGPWICIVIILIIFNFLWYF